MASRLSWMGMGTWLSGIWLSLVGMAWWLSMVVKKKQNKQSVHGCDVELKAVSIHAEAVGNLRISV